MAKPTIRNIVCDGCGNKCSAPYARLDGKQYCSRDCYDKAREKHNNDPLMKIKYPPVRGHNDYRSEVIGRPTPDYDPYPDNSKDEFGNDSGC